MVDDGRLEAAAAQAVAAGEAVGQKRLYFQGADWGKCIQNPRDGDGLHLDVVVHEVLRGRGFQRAR